jgi:DNA-binding phage protein
MSQGPLGDRTLERIRERLAHAENGWFFAQIADRVAERRRELGLSQAELAPPRIDTLLRIATALDCELAVELRPL